MKDKKETFASLLFVTYLAENKKPTSRKGLCILGCSSSRRVESERTSNRNYLILFIRDPPPMDFNPFDHH